MADGVETQDADKGLEKPEDSEFSCRLRWNNSSKFARSNFETCAGLQASYASAFRKLSGWVGCYDGKRQTSGRGHYITTTKNMEVM